MNIRLWQTATARRAFEQESGSTGRQISLQVWFRYLASKPEQTSAMRKVNTNHVEEYTRSSPGGSLHHASAPMISALHATAPCAALADKLMLFGQFVGSWDLQIVYYACDGSVARRMQGEWHFGWVLEGRAIQDVWIAPRRALRRSGTDGEEYGATLRFYDPGLDAWRSTWIGPVKGMVRPFVAREAGGEIILDGSFAPGVCTRWIFSAITPDAFRWRAVESRDGWRTYRLEQEMFATRQFARPSMDESGDED